MSDTEFNKAGFVQNIVTGVTFYKRENEEPVCEICGAKLIVSLHWGIVFGYAECECGAGYELVEKNKDGSYKPPQCCVDPLMLPKYKEVWNRTGDYDSFREAVRIMEVA